MIRSWWQASLLKKPLGGGFDHSHQESIENQAVDRVNRIGQKKPVSVFRMIAEGTVEEKVLEIQARKSDLINQVMPRACFALVAHPLR
jgi:hypothetical protein